MNLCGERKEWTLCREQKELNLCRKRNAYATRGWKQDFPIFEVKVYGKECDMLFDTGSTVNILGRETLVKHLGISEKFIQGNLAGIKGITGQRIMTQGDVQITSNMLG